MVPGVGFDGRGRGGWVGVGLERDIIAGVGGRSGTLIANLRQHHYSDEFGGGQSNLRLAGQGVLSEPEHYRMDPYER